ncbi:MAG TPA: L-histidine N(alpha)-methyltransferase [Candidatus Dormibacteraeota bacterium]
MSLAPITIAVHTLGRDSRVQLIEDVRSGLTHTPKTLQPRWFYDDRGCELFDEITLLPEYYQTRTEMDILQRHARDIMQRVRPASIVELGAGSCTKSRVLIRAAKGMGSLWTFVPFDISEATLRRSASELSDEFDDLTVYCVTGEFDHHLSQIPRFGRQLIVFLGSTIGNFEPAEAQRFLTDVRRLMRPGDHFLVGVDLVKDEAQLIAAYDDSRGVTAEFNRNVLARINSELDANFDLDAFEHAVRWKPADHRIEMHLRSTADQTVWVRGADFAARFAAGETLRTEVCTKYTRESLEAMLGDVGIETLAWYTDSAARFALVLAR